ncbi:MAG: chemotaxis-specific protein-glutamate methyltransferase CheB [Thermoanaerobaculia bacterium]
MTATKLRVAVVDDSTFIRKAILRMLEDEPEIEVVGSAASGEELLTQIEHWRPDVVTLDLDMPGMGGLETLDHIQAVRPTPVIILSTHSGEGAPLTIEALHRGATDFIDKQRYSLVDFEALRNILVEKILQVTGHEPVESRAGTGGAAAKASGAPLSGPWPAADSRLESHQDRPAGARRQPRPTEAGGVYDLIVVGASTGGPPILQEILERMGAAMPVPVLVVQHMPVGFTSAFAERLNAYLPLQVREARTSERLLPDTVYIASAGSHLQVRSQNGALYAEVGPRREKMMHVPSIDVLFESAAEVVGGRTIAALLTGMGRDGARGLAALKSKGAHTLVQDEASCVVYGMPRAAMNLDAVVEVATPAILGRRLRELAMLDREARPTG